MYPLVGRLDRNRRTLGLVRISIHAPLAGCDAGRGRFCRRREDFNPRTPCGVRLTGPALPSRALLFQSTHPLRGATPPRSPGSAAMSNFNPRTPCGVRPMRRGDRQQKQGDFNPRTPCGVRPLGLMPDLARWIFQSTHPLRGATLWINGMASALLFQSTHPLRGATQ